MTIAAETVRIAAVGDIHFQKIPTEGLQRLFSQLENIDVLLLCGDLTDYGQPDEARLLARELAAVRIPVVAVLGNHDYEAGRNDEIRQILVDVGVNLLDGDACEIQGIGFGGTKGFAGGFGTGTLAPWGEPAIKRFVQEALDEALKLESALARLRTAQRIALLHYSPIEATVVGEPREIFAFLGSSRLEDPLNRYEVTAAFHGHAHRGSPEGTTRNGIPVYNVSLPLLRRTFPEAPPFRILELPRHPTAPVTGEEAAGI